MAKRKPKPPRRVHVECPTSASFRWLVNLATYYPNQAGATVDGDRVFSVTNEGRWVDVLKAVEGKEVK